jgi:hypothetical protein
VNVNIIYISLKPLGFIVKCVEKIVNVLNSPDEHEYCEDCGHYYNLNVNGERIKCGCECHD